MKDFIEGAMYGVMFTLFFALLTISVLTIIY